MRDFARHRYTWKEYLLLETDANVRHEFYDGEIYAMAGGTPQHAQLAVAIAGDLRQKLHGKPCVPYSSDLRVRVMATGLSTYPDVTVVCGKLETDPQDRNTAINPVVVVEVLSTSTEDYDRREKLRHYQQIPTVREVVLVSHRERLIEVIRRSAEGWTRVEARGGGKASLESLGCALNVDAIYEGVTLEAAP